MTTDRTLGKEERLKSNLSIQHLLKTGNTLTEYPFKIYWNTSPDQKQIFPARIAISVPKRKFKRAVDRNRMKRRIREVYRQNKNLIYSPLRHSEANIILMVLFLSDEFLSYSLLNERMIKLLSRLANKFPN